MASCLRSISSSMPLRDGRCSSLRMSPQSWLSASRRSKSSSLLLRVVDDQFLRAGVAVVADRLGRVELGVSSDRLGQLQHRVLVQLLLDAFLQVHDRHLQDFHGLDHPRSHASSPGTSCWLRSIRMPCMSVTPSRPGRAAARPSLLPNQNARRPSRASASIWLLANSSTEPDGKPRANRVTRTPSGASKRRQIQRRAVPLGRRVGGHDHLADARRPGRGPAGGRSSDAPARRRPAATAGRAGRGSSPR